MQSKWHNISIKRESFEELQEIRSKLPINVSLSKKIDWLIKVGQKQIQGETSNDKKIQRNI